MLEIKYQLEHVCMEAGVILNRYQAWRSGKVRSIKRITVKFLMSSDETPADSCTSELHSGPGTDDSQRTSWTRLREFTRRIYIPQSKEKNHQSSQGGGKKRDLPLSQTKETKSSCKHWSWRLSWCRNSLPYQSSQLIIKPLKQSQTI